jgi:uncharacterized protein (TIGR02147 family)
MPDIYAFEDYRLYLLECFRERKHADRSFTHRRLAEAGGIANPGFFNEVVKGRRDLTAEAAEKFCLAFDLKVNEAEYLKLLVSHNQSRDPDEKDELLRKMQFRRGRSAFARIHPAAVRYYQDSNYALVRVALRVFEFRGEYERFARFLKPPMPVPLVKRCIRDLCEWGLVKQERDGRYVVTDAYLEPGPNMEEALKRMHREWIQQAADTLDAFPKADRHISSALITLSEKGYRELIKRVEAFRAEMLELVKRESRTPERVLQFNIQLFPKNARQEKQAGAKNGGVQ